MDAYVWYTINREGQDRLHDRIKEAEQERLLQQAQARRSRRQQRVLLIIGERLIALGLRRKPHASSPMGRR
jgi:hypothetical protein